MKGETKSPFRMFINTCVTDSCVCASSWNLSHGNHNIFVDGAEAIRLLYLSKGRATPGAPAQETSRPNHCLRVYTLIDWFMIKL